MPDADRKKTPVFVKHSGKKMSRTYLVNTLDAMVTAVGKDPKQFSFHSARIWLACALKEAGASNNRTQGMVRWLSEDSLRIYARDMVMIKVRLFMIALLLFTPWCMYALHARDSRHTYAH